MTCKFDMDLNRLGNIFFVIAMALFLALFLAILIWGASW